MSLMQFCKTERQRDVVSRVEEGKSQREIAKELDLGRGTVRGHLEAVRAVAAKQGYSPEHDYTHPVPDGFTVRGVSTCTLTGSPLASGSKVRAIRSGN